MSITEVKALIDGHFPGAWQPQRVMLSNCGYLSIEDIGLPGAVIQSGPSGTGKTLSIEFMFPEYAGSDEKAEELRQYIHRVDNFSVKSFVTHYGNVKTEKLKEIDLLPRIRHKVLLTKELAPFFSGRKAEKEDRYSTACSVLDGMGYLSHSGTKGYRGYSGNYMFCWCGAVKPLSNEVHRMMSALGARLYFNSTSRAQRSRDSLRAIAGMNRVEYKKAECGEAVTGLLLEHFRKHPPVSVPAGSIRFDDCLLDELVNGVMLLAKARAGFGMSIRKMRKNVDAEEEVYHLRPDKEDETRALMVLKGLAIGSALIHGRDYVNVEDMEMIEHICLSSMPEPRRIMLNALKEAQGEADTSELMRLTGFSNMTAYHYSREMQALGLCEITGKNPYTLRLKDEHSWLLTPIYKRTGGINNQSIYNTHSFINREKVAQGKDEELTITFDDEEDKTEIWQ